MHKHALILIALLAPPAWGADRSPNDLWSFKPLTDPPVPEVDDRGWSRNAIDRFVADKLRAQGLTPAEEAGRAALVRRVYFDLIGLPPTPEEARRFIDDASPAAWEDLIDRLLEDPRYGEKWARHWLDIVRYAESDGYKADVYRPHAWRYRDYVIDAFNADKPYDRFVSEQLAGDELFPDDPVALVATGYLRHWPYEDNQANIESQWELILTELTDTTGEVFMGLSIGCARCHNHKFDPILQTDYFRFRAFFESFRPRTDLVLATDAQRAEHGRKLAAWEEATRDIRTQLDDLERPQIEAQRASEIARYPKSMQAIYAKPADQRTPRERQLFHLAEIQTHKRAAIDENKIPKAERERWKALKARLATFDALKPEPLAEVLGATDMPGEAPLTRLPGKDEEVAPGVPSALGGGAPPLGEGRRAALARWLTRPDNPLATRVIVNRIWHYHFGRGLVGTTSDFGHLGDEPTHPRLLDHLAARFVRDGWSFKKLHRYILASATYRQASNRPSPQTARLEDPEGLWLWRFPVRRLDAEQIRDAMLAASGELDATAGGPAADHESPRRSVYLKVMRNSPEPLLAAFDCPIAFGSAPVRNITTTAPQSLMLLNGDWVRVRAAAMADRLAAAHPGDVAAQVTLAYRLTLARDPDAEERALAADFLNDHAALVARHGSDENGRDPARIAMGDLCQMLFNSNAFLYVN